MTSPSAIPSKRDYAQVIVNQKITVVPKAQSTTQKVAAYVLSKLIDFTVLVFFGLMGNVLTLGIPLLYRTFCVESNTSIHLEELALRQFQRCRDIVNNEINQNSKNVPQNRIAVLQEKNLESYGPNVTEQQRIDSKQLAALVNEVCDLLNVLSVSCYHKYVQDKVRTKINEALETQGYQALKGNERNPSIAILHRLSEAFFVGPNGADIYQEIGEQVFIIKQDNKYNCSDLRDMIVRQRENAPAFSGHFWNKIIHPLRASASFKSELNIPGADFGPGFDPHQQGNRDIYAGQFIIKHKTGSGEATKVIDVSYGPTPISDRAF